MLPTKTAAMIPERKQKMDDMRQRLSRELKLLTKKLDLNPYMNGAIFPLLKERMNTIGVRSFFVHALSEYVREQANAEKIALKQYPADTKLFHTQLPFLAEGIIAVQYYENQVLDGKGGLFANGAYDMEKVHRNVIGGHFIKDFLYRYIAEEIFPDDCAAYRLTMQKVHRIFQLVDLGQAFQDKWGTFESLREEKKIISISFDADRIIDKKIIDKNWTAIRRQGLHKDLESFTRNYLRRISLTSGALFMLMAELVMDLLDYHGKERDNIMQFSMQLGITGQMVNDINDLVPAKCDQFTVSKIPIDAFADIRNNNVTLPLLFFFNGNLSQTMSNLQKQIHKPKKLLTFLQDAVSASQQVAIQMAQQSDILLKDTTFFGELIKDMNSVTDVEKNRFFQSLETYMNQNIRKYKAIQIIDKIVPGAQIKIIGNLFFSTLRLVLFHRAKWQHPFIFFFKNFAAIFGQLYQTAKF